MGRILILPGPGCSNRFNKIVTVIAAITINPRYQRLVKKEVKLVKVKAVFTAFSVGMNGN
jgi:hypothetical protein